MPQSPTPLMSAKSRIPRRVAWVLFGAIDLSILALVVLIGLQIGSDHSALGFKVTVDGAP